MRHPFQRAGACLAVIVAAGCAHMGIEQPAPKPAAPAADRIAREAIASPVKPKVTALGETPSSLLFIGNSFFYYNNSIHDHLREMVRGSAAPKLPGLRANSVTISGSGIDWHDVESYFKPAVSGYTFRPDNTVVFNKLDRKFDAAIVMDCSQCPVHPQLKPIFHEFARKDVEILRKHRAIPVLFMSWAYEDKPEMTAQLASEYTTAGNANDALVIPAGLAFAKALYQRPSLALYAPDKRHPSLAGTYLATCTVFASIYGRSPEGNIYTAGLDPALARFLQAIAWETTREYYGK